MNAQRRFIMISYQFVCGEKDDKITWIGWNLCCSKWLNSVDLFHVLFYLFNQYLLDRLVQFSSWSLVYFKQLKEIYTLKMNTMK